MASGGSGLSNSHGERGIDDEVASDEVPDGDEDMTPALHNLEGRGIKVEGKKSLPSQATAMSSSTVI
jgi:hypothetical protein